MANASSEECDQYSLPFAVLQGCPHGFDDLAEAPFDQAVLCGVSGRCGEGDPLGLQRVLDGRALYPSDIIRVVTLDCGPQLVQKGFQLVKDGMSRGVLVGEGCVARRSGGGINES